MSVIYILIPIAFLLVAVAIAVFVWAVRSNQFEDLERHGYSVLMEQEERKDPGPDQSKSDTDNNA